jgi:signal peptide peptidase SppA
MRDVRLTADFEPVAISPAHGEWYAQSLAAANDEAFVAGAEKFEAEISARSEDGYWPEPGDWMCRYRPYDVVDGVLQIPVSGGLTPNFPYCFQGHLTGYEYISRAVLRGQDDETVKGIALVVDSGGGSVQGMNECAEIIYDARSAKPIRAFAKDTAYSAAYALACATQHITTPPTGGVGSVGVIATHFDMSDRMEGSGIRVTLVRSGDKKAGGHPFERLGKKARARIQERVDHSNDIFAALVARNRDMDAEGVKSLQGEAFMSHEAVENGLADEVGSFRDAVAAFAASLTNTGGDTMSNSKGETAVDKAVHEAAVSEAKTAGIAEGTILGATTERARIATITGSEEAKTRPIAAQNVAMHTDQPAENALAFLALMPEEAPKAEVVDPNAAPAPAAPNAFTAAMNSSENPNLGSGDEGGDAPATDADAVKGIMGDYATITGKVA